jgi:hypothetical protein
MRKLGCMLAVGLSATAPLLAQDSVATGRSADLPCYHTRPKAACSVFFLTNAGVYAGSPSWRALVDWGVMVNVSKQAAIGASFFMLVDDDGGAVGPALRYRRWLSPRASLDVAVGTPILRPDPIQAGSIYGLVKWNPEHWFGVAARPEFIRRAVISCANFSCNSATQSRARLSLGVEFGWVPGFVLSVTGGAAIFVATALGATNF